MKWVILPMALLALGMMAIAGYQGGDEIAVVDGRLVRIYQVYEQIDGAWQPTAQQRRLRYSFEGSRWVAEP